MDTKQLVAEALNELDGDLRRALDGLTSEELSWAPEKWANSIGFTLWHVIRDSRRTCGFTSMEKECRRYTSPRAGPLGGASRHWTMALDTTKTSWPPFLRLLSVSSSSTTRL